MRPGKLYIKIFLSFVLILIVTEILVFGFFSLFAGRSIRSQLERYAGAQAMIIKELIEEKIRSEPQSRPAENEPLRNLISRLRQIYGAKVWLAGPGQRVVLKSFPGEIPERLLRIPRHRIKDLGNLKVYRYFRKGQVFYITVPVELRRGELGDLHILFEGMETGHHEGTFLLGLAGIGVVIALLVIPVSRLITEPVKRLRHSVLRIAEGDLSHRAAVRTRDEVGELGHSFNRMADKLETMIRGGRELTANISHELRTPLARIRIAEELLRERLERGEYQGCDRHLDGIREEIEELDRLIGRILVLSKLDIHETPLNPERFDPSDLINELLERLRPAISRKRLRLMANLSFDPPVFGDRNALRTAISNILDNAVKFTPEKGDVIVKMHSGTDGLKISVTNSFEALSDEDLVRIFDPFYRREGSLTAGSGLGLAITKRIIERHGGNVEAANSPDGLRLEIHLPPGPSGGEKAG